MQWNLKISKNDGAFSLSNVRRCARANVLSAGKFKWSSRLAPASCWLMKHSLPAQRSLYRAGRKRTKKDYNRMKGSLTVSVLWVCQFTSLVVLLWRLLISAECRLQFYCQHWWKEESERERERVNCMAAKKEEFVIGWEWFQMVEQNMETPRVPASWPMCLLQDP